MNRVWLGAVLGVTVGVADVLLMLPMQFQDRTAALLGAFCARFAIWAGIVVGLLTSMPDAIITKTYAPILGRGVLFGAVCGWAVGRWSVAIA